MGAISWEEAVVYSYQYLVSKIKDENYQGPRLNQPRCGHGGAEPSSDAVRDAANSNDAAAPRPIPGPPTCVGSTTKF